MTADGIEVSDVTVEQDDSGLDLLSVLNRCLDCIGVVIGNMDVRENQNPMVAFDDEWFALFIRGFWEKILLPTKGLGGLSRGDTLSMSLPIRAS